MPRLSRGLDFVRAALHRLLGLAGPNDVAALCAGDADAAVHNAAATILEAVDGR